MTSNLEKTVSEKTSELTIVRSRTNDRVNNTIISGFCTLVQAADGEILWSARTLSEGQSVLDYGRALKYVELIQGKE